MRGIVVLIVVFWSAFAFGQEVKLGLPVGHTSEVIQFDSNDDYLLSTSRELIILSKKNDGSVAKYYDAYTYVSADFINETNIIIGTWNNGFFIIDVENDNSIHFDTKGIIEVIKVSMDKSIAVVGTNAAEVIIIDLKSKKEVVRLKEHSIPFYKGIHSIENYDHIIDIAISNDQKFMISQGYHRTILWDLNLLKVIEIFSDGERPYCQTNFSNDSKLITIPGYDNFLVYDLENRDSLKAIPIENWESDLNRIQMISEKILILFAKEEISCLDLTQNKVVWQLPREKYELIESTSLNKILIYRNDSIFIEQIDPVSGHFETVLDKKEAIDQAYFDQVDSLFFLSSMGDLAFIDVQTKSGGKLSGAVGINSYVWEVSDEIIVTVYNRNNLIFWNIENGKFKSIFQLDFEVKNIKLSKDSKFLYISSEEFIYQFDIERNELNSSVSFESTQWLSIGLELGNERIVGNTDNEIFLFDFIENKKGILDLNSIDSFEEYYSIVNMVHDSNENILVIEVQEEFDGISSSLYYTVPLEFKTFRLNNLISNHNEPYINRLDSIVESSYRTKFSTNGIHTIYSELSPFNMDLYIINNEPNKWVHIHPSGFFDASPEAMELMYWTKGLEIIEFSQLKDRYWLPGLWEKVMKGEKLPDVRGMQELKLQPKVNFGELKNGQLPINLTKRDGGYGKVAIFINGKEVINDARGNDLDTSQAEQTILYSIKDHPFLVNGENEIVVKASSADGFVQGRGELFSTYIEKSTSKPQFFGVVIGVGEYANSRINLKYPVPDADAISTSLQMGAENLFGEDRTYVYSITSGGDKKPTKENIKVIFENISKKANPEDVIVIYLSGHGVTWGGDQGDFYFLTSDATAANKHAYADPVIRKNNTISTAEWVELLKSIAALKQVMIIDACGSGKAVDNLIASRDVEASQIKAIDRMKDRTGMYIISGCTADAVSYEASQYGQGLLTYSILEAMKGAALRSDGSIDVDLMMQHARERVPVLAKGVGGIQQPQLLAPKGGSFDIGILNDEDKKVIPLASPKKVFVRSNLVDSEEFEDVLGLSDLLDEQLIAISSKGVESNIVYFDAKKYPNACKISGGYSQEKGMIKITLKIRCGEELEKVDLEANSKEELIDEILKQVE